MFEKTRVDSYEREKSIAVLLKKGEVSPPTSRGLGARSGVIPGCHSYVISIWRGEARKLLKVPEFTGPPLSNEELDGAAVGSPNLPADKHS